MRRVGRASELLAGAASNAWPLRYAVFLYLPPSGRRQE
jgi:hypothetical protein